VTVLERQQSIVQAPLAPATNLDGKTPTELVELANREYEASDASARKTLVHAFRSGEALLAAREKVPMGEFQSWLAENFAGAQATAQQFMRLAYYQDQISQDLRIKDAYRSLAGLPAIDAKSRRGRKELPDKATINDAARMRKEGMSFAAIGDVFGVGSETVRRWVNPQERKRINAKKRCQYRERREVQAQIKRNRRDAKVRKAGGGTAEVYSLLRRAAQKAEALRTTGAAGSEISAALRKTVNHLHAAEDEIVRALGVE
jgi:hypothetical protein